MKTYTLHIPLNAPSNQIALEKSHIVPDAFNWGAMSFGFLWFFVKGYFLVSIMVLIIGEVGLLTLVYLAGVPLFYLPFIAILFQILLGLEASTLVRWTYRRNGMPEAAIIVANNEYEAQVKGFNDWAARNQIEEQQENLPQHDTATPTLVRDSRNPT